MKATWLHVLLWLKKMPTKSTAILGRELGVSQQTAARWVTQLVHARLVEKTGTYVLTPKGVSYLESLQEIHPNGIVGTVFSGVGEGKYYLSKKGYEKQFPTLLGFKPFPGTLNLRLVRPESRDASKRIRATKGRRLDGFKEKDRTFGAARCYSCRIQNKIDGAIIVPERTHYPEDVVELLAPVFLRGALRLKDGDSVRLELM